MSTPPQPPFSDAARATLRAACETLVPSDARADPTDSAAKHNATAVAVDRYIEETVAAEFSVGQTTRFLKLLHAFDSRALNLLLTGRPERFSSLNPERRIRYLQGWRDSRVGFKRSGFQTLKRLACFLYYSAPGPSGTNPNWPAIGYPGPLTGSHEPHPDSLRIRPIVPDNEHELSAEACVIGSGAGGSVVAAELSRMGHDVVVLEAGSYETSETMTTREFEMTRRLFEGGGTLSTEDVSFQLIAGRGVGGGTLVNWMTCLRPPQVVLREWEQSHGIDGLCGAEFARDVDWVWETLEVNGRESQRNPNNEALWRGSLALGYREGEDFRTIERNAVGCQERCEYCGYGCPFACKRSTILNLLPAAFRSGARFLFRTRATALETDGDRVRAVQALYRAPEQKPVSVRVRAKVVVLSSGAVHTPALLLRSGVRHRAVGQGLRLHPTTAVAGEFRHEIRPWAGPPQTVAVTRFLDLERTGHGFWIEAAPAHPGLFALALPWEDGRSHKEWMRDRFRHSTATIVLLRERSQGRVGIDRTGHPTVDYRLARPDRDEVVRGIQEAARILAAAGARGLGTLHAAPVEARATGERFSGSELDSFFDRVAASGARPNRILMFSAHLMGSCPMGSDEQRAATRPTGELWPVRDLFVADSSVFPSSPGVNPMVTIMAMARRTSAFVHQRLRGGLSS